MKRSNPFRSPRRGRFRGGLLILSIAIAVVGLGLSPAAVQARGFRVGQVPNGEFFGCDLCHETPGGPRNLFGQDVEATLTPLGDVDWAAIFELDSDGDGFTNGEEVGDPDGDGVPIDGLNPSHPALASSFPGPDIVVLGEADPREVDSGASFDLTIDVFNVGSEVASNVRVSIARPAGVAIESVEPSQGECEDDGESLDCALGEIPSQFGARIALRLRAESPEAAELGFDVDAVLDEEDIDVLNNHARVVVRVRDFVPRLRFHRGDVNLDGTLDISDPLAIFGFLFLGDSTAPRCREAADANHDGRFDVSDGITLLGFLFQGAPPPPAPGPPGGECGFDPDEPGTPGDLGCEEYPPCA